MWYEKSSPVKLNYIRNRKKRLNLHWRLTAIPHVSHFQYRYKTFFFYLLPHWDFILFSAHNIVYNKQIKFFFFYSTTYYFKLVLPLHTELFKYSPDSRVFCFQLYYTHMFFAPAWKKIKLIFKSFMLMFFKKIKFKGKGYYIFKNLRNTVTFRFGYSHRIYLYMYFTSVKFLSKISIIIFGINWYDINKKAFLLKSIRPFNIFTGKGVRFSRQIIYKKTGKVGSYR